MFRNSFLWTCKKDYAFHATFLLKKYKYRMKGQTGKKKKNTSIE